MGEGLKFFYKNLKTIYGEKLPKFKLAPLINLQGDGAEFVVVKNTTEYFKISLYVSDGLAQEENKVKFNIWLISLN